MTEAIDALELKTRVAGILNHWPVRSGRVRPRLAAGYALGSRGLKAVTDRKMAIAGGGSVYSTTSDMARYAAAVGHQPQTGERADVAAQARSRRQLPEPWDRS